MEKVKRNRVMRNRKLCKTNACKDKLYETNANTNYTNRMIGTNEPRAWLRIHTRSRLSLNHNMKLNVETHVLPYAKFP